MPAAIDVWMQHPTPSFVQQPWLVSLLRWMGQNELPEVPLEFTLGAIEAAEVEVGLCSAWCGPRGWLISNEDVKGFVDQSNGRLRGLASVDLTEPMEAVYELRRCVKEWGFVGLRIVPWLWNLPPDDRRYYPVLAECCELGVPFCTQIGHTGPLCPSEPGRLIPYLEHVCLDFPELTVVGGHVGYPWMTEVLSMLRKFPNFHVDTSAYKVKRLPEELVQVMRGRGRNRVLFGTNYPMILPQDALEGLDTLGLDEEARDLFLSGNARRLFRL